MEEVQLPEIIDFAQYNGNWEQFIGTIYKIFKADFIDRKPYFRGLKMILKHYPEHDGYPATFYHMTHEGSDENNRTPCLKRSGRIPWAHPVIEKCDEWKLKIWPQVRGNKNRLCIWLQLDGEPDYFVVLEMREKYILPWTAFIVEYEHQKTKKEKEYNEYLKAKAAQHN